jgi:hypothetical protein
MEMEEILSKSEFAALLGVPPAAVSVWIKRRKLSGNALVGSGYSSRIRVTGRETSIPAPAARPKAARDAPPAGGETVEARIKVERHMALRLANEKAKEEAGARAGKYALASDVVQQLGHAESRLLTIFDAALAKGLWTREN